MSRFDANQLIYPYVPLALGYVGPIFFWIYTQVPPSLSQISVSLVMFFLFDNLGVQIGVHKHLCHRAFKTSLLVRRILCLLSILSGQGSPLVWVAVHMGSHHPYYDTDRDIHTPRKGFWYAFLAWYWKCDKRLISMSVAREYLGDKWLVLLHRHHAVILLTYWLSLGLFGGFTWVVYAGWVPLMLSTVCAGLVNASMHTHPRWIEFSLFKYQNHPVDQSYNSILLGLLTMGLGLHNNHHHRPDQLYYDQRWFEVDLSRLVIPLIRKE